MPHRKNEKPVRIPRSLWNQIAEIAKLQERNTDKRGPHTHLANEMIAAAVAKWMYSPYVCLQARQVALITSHGHVFFRTVQTLWLNSDRQRLPCVVQMKPEKRDDYFRHFQELSRPGESRCDWLERRWIVNHFAAWQGHGLRGVPLSCMVDRLGIESKVVDLPLANLNGSSLTREIVAGWREYVQWQDERPTADTPKYDRLAFNVDLPATNFECLVFVDEDLYPDGQGNPRLEIEFRNRERARYQDREVVTAFDENRMDMQTSAGTLDDTPDRLVDPLRDLIDRLHKLAASTADDGRPAVSEPDAALIRSLALPKRFLYLEMSWPSPHWGIQVCVRWKKPSRASAETPGASAAPTTPISPAPDSNVHAEQRPVREAPASATSHTPSAFHDEARKRHTPQHRAKAARASTPAPPLNEGGVDERTVLSTERAAAYLGLSPKSLETLRSRGGGPPFLKLGRRVAYRTADLDSWLAAHVHRSTSNPGAQ